MVGYTRQDFAAAGEAYDIILDTTGTTPLSRVDKVLKTDGRLLLVLGTFSQAVGFERPSKKSGKKVIPGVVAGRREDIQMLADLAGAGTLKPVVDRSYPLGHAAEAHAYVDKGRKRGNVVLTIVRAAAPLQGKVIRAVPASSQ